MRHSYQTAIITGASSGIGAELARQIAPACKHLVLVARREELMQELAAEISDCEVHVVAADVTDSESYIEKLTEALKPLPTCDLAVLNAGYGRFGKLTKPQTANYLYTYGVNLFGAIATLDVVLPAMIEANQGHIVGIASIAAYRGLPKAGPYASSKSAFWRALESMRCELAHTDIRISTIHPGFIKTPMTENNGRMPFLMDCEPAVKKIVSAIDKRKIHYAFPWQMRWLSYGVRLIPDGLYWRLFRRGKKKR